MQIYVSDQWTYLLYSLIAGFLFGAVYDTLCSLPFALSSSKRYSFIGDLVFTVFVAAATFILSYSFNSGTIRMYSLLSSAGTFILYRLSLGSAVLKILLYIFDKIRCLKECLFNKLKIVLDICVKFVKIRMVHFRVTRYKRKLLHKIEKYFSGKEPYGKRK